MTKIYVCKYCERNSSEVNFRRPGRFCRECEYIHRRTPLKESDIFVIGDIVKAFNLDIRLHINSIKTLSILLTPEDRKIVVELLKCQKKVFLETVNKYE